MALWREVPVLFQSKNFLPHFLFCTSKTMSCPWCKSDDIIVKPLQRNLDLRLAASGVTGHSCKNRHCLKSWYGCNQTCKRDVGWKGTMKCFFKRRDNLLRHIKTQHARDAMKSPPNHDTIMENEPDESFPSNTEADQSMEHKPDESFPYQMEANENTRLTPELLHYDAPLVIHGDLNNPNAQVQENVQSPTPHVFVSDSLYYHRQNCIANGYYDAASVLVARSAYQERHASCSGIPSPWVISFLMIARIVMITGEEVHELLSSILLFFHEIAKYFLLKVKLFPKMPLPLTLQNFQSMILNESNTNSLKSILPIPPIADSL